MKFQNPSLNSVLTGRTDGRTHKPKPICSPLFQSWGHKNHFLTSIKGRNYVEHLRKMMLYNTYIDLTDDHVYTNLVEFCPSILKILSKNQFLTSIKGCNSVANLRKMTPYCSNIDLVNDNVYTKFG